MRRWCPVAPDVPTVTGAGELAAARARLLRAGLTQYALLAGPLLSMLDSSIVNVAIEPIAHALHTSIATAQWTVSGYLLALGAGLAATAYLARRFGTLTVYRASVAAFTLASALCALAPGIGLLIAARAVQGLVAAPLVPLAMSMLLGKPGNARSISPAAGIMLFAAPALGPVAGGLLIGSTPAAGGYLAGWRLIFAVNLPLGALAAWAAARLPASIAPSAGAPGRERPRGVDFDLPGLIVLAAGLTSTLAGISEGGTDGWARPACWGPLGGGVVLLAGYAWWAGRLARRGGTPALDLSLVRSAVPALSMGLCALASVVTWASLFLLPVFAQSVQGHSALAAGVALAPQGVVMGLSTGLGTRFLPRFTVRWTVLVGFVVLAGASLGLLLVEVTTPLWVIAVILACRGVSIGLIINPLLFALTGPLAEERMADASTLFNVLQRIAGSIGIGLLAALYTSLVPAGGPAPALHVTGIVVSCVAAAGIAGALALPPIRNTDPRRAGPRRAGPRRAGSRHTAPAER
jgi:EmrB/QacA subfamily drug resistance transporter